jgi:hypothetical protein
MKTPQYITRTLAAGAFASIAAPGNYLTIASLSASTFAVGLDGETPAQVIAGGRTYVRRGFHLLRIQNTGAVPGTLVMVVTEDEYSLTDSANATVLAAIAASLVTIDSDTNRLLGVAAMTMKADTVVAVTGGAATLLFPTTATRRLVQVQALETNGGLVYVGNAVTTSAVNKLAVLPAGASWYDEYYTGPVYAVGSDAAESICGYQM